MKNLFISIVILLLNERIAAFSPAPFSHHARHQQLDETSTLLSRHAKNQPADNDFWDEHFRGDGEISPSDRMKSRQADIESINKQLEQLDALASKRPTIPGDYDWDEAYKDDPNWIMGDQVPGKIKFTKEQIQAQEEALEALANKWTTNGYERSEEPPEDVNDDT